MKYLLILIFPFLLSCAGSIPAYNVLQGEVLEDGGISSKSLDEDLVIQFLDKFTSINSSHSFEIEADLKDGGSFEIYLYGEVRDTSFVNQKTIFFEREGNDLIMDSGVSFFDTSADGIFSKNKSTVKITMDFHNFNETGESCGDESITKEAHVYVWVGEAPYNDHTAVESKNYFYAGEYQHWGLRVQEGARIIRLLKDDPYTPRCSVL